MTSAWLAKRVRADGAPAFALHQFFGFLGINLFANYLLRLAGVSAAYVLTYPWWVIAGAIAYSALMTFLAIDAAKDAPRAARPDELADRRSDAER